MNRLSNPEIVEAFHQRDQIAAELHSIDARIAELRAARESISANHEAASHTTEVHNGVALSIIDGHVHAVSYSIGRYALVFEHAGRPGVFKTQAFKRNNGDWTLPGEHTSFDEALEAAKNYVAGL